MSSFVPRLELVCDTTSWWLRSPSGEPLHLERFTGKKAAALEQLMQQRYALSPGLQERVRKYEKNRSSGGFWKQMVVGLLVPAGLLTQGEWDYDRDMDVLRKEASAALSSFLQPGDYELTEHIDSETPFRDGKVLFYLYLN